MADPAENHGAGERELKEPVTATPVTGDFFNGLAHTRNQLLYFSA
jgi:hypothetical protein